MGSRTWITSGAAAVATAAALFAVPAQAGNTSIFVELGTPGYGYQYGNGSGYGYGYGQPGYVYTQPGYVYTQPGYVYTQPGYSTYGRSHRRNRDADRDGIPNRWDRDRDGDGVPNRIDRRPNNPYRY